MPDHDQLRGLLFLISLVVMIPAYRIIFRKAGFSPLLAWLLVIPGFGWLTASGILAFANWPAKKSANGSP
jgi:hypothetical protein